MLTKSLKKESNCMAKFVVVKQKPKELKKGECVIERASFLPEIRENAKNASRGGLTGVNHLRSIIGTIGKNYDLELTAYSVKPYAYEGRSYSSEEELNDIVVSLLREQYPIIFDRYLDKKIKERPFGTKLIYYVGDFLETAAFNMNGIDRLEEREVDAYMGHKKKSTQVAETDNQ
jgi:hypothetical protein